jgi:hypothetical protein
MTVNRLAVSILSIVLVAGCGSTTPPHGFAAADVDGGSDATASASGDAGTTGPAFSGPDAATPQDCSASSPDLAGCPCTQPGAMQACYTGDPSTRNVGACKDGHQTCVKSGEFAAYGPCTAAVTPTTETCTGTVDSNCNGKLGCADPTCAKDPACNTACTDGQSRACYGGPAGTENRGTCKDGKQTCVNGKWPSVCTGEVLPGAENCCDALDHNCNGLPGCLDIFSCITAACCQTGCSASNLDVGCVCPTGSGDTATCPEGDHGVHKGGIPGTDECCPCSASDCGDPGCCAEGVCANSPLCAGLTCKPLPASCNGKVNADCDDFPEDCDEPCCKCTSCSP